MCGRFTLAAKLEEIGRHFGVDADVFFHSAVTPGTHRIAGSAGLTRIGAGMIGLDAAALTFSVVAAVPTAILVSILPAWQASRYRPVRR